jgi:hypothetical protein
MSLQCVLVDPKTGNIAGVTERRELIVGPSSYALAYPQTLNATGTAFNHIEPKTNKQFVITGIIASADKNVSSTNGAEVDIFEANGPTSTTATKDILPFSLNKLENVSIQLAAPIITTKGVWINSTTDDATIKVTVLGYYVDE